MELVNRRAHIIAKSACELRHVRRLVYSRVSALVLLEGFLGNLKFGTFKKICQENQNFVENCKKY